MDTAYTFSESPILWIVSQFLSAFPNLFSALSQPTLWLDWLTWEKTTEDKQSLMRFIYYGASTELFFAITIIIVLYTALAMYYRPLMWKTVTSLETVANSTGRVFAWAGLTMVLIQIVIIFYSARFCCIANNHWFWLGFFI